MQRTSQAFFKDRSLFYATFPIQEQSKRGDWDYRLTPVYTVSILNFLMVQQQRNQNFVHRVMLKDDNSDCFYDKLAFIYIGLPKFSKALNQLTTHEDKWFYLFRHLPELTNQPQLLNEPIFDNLFEVAEIANLFPGEQDVYQSTLKSYRDFNNVVNTAIREAEVKAEQKGLERGLEKGFKQGIEQERSCLLSQQRALLQRFLTRQLNELSDELQAQIQQLSLNVLKT